MGDLQREMKIRQRILGIFNRDADDFPGLQEWNNYLEEREDIIMNLAEGVDVSDTEHRVAEYQKDHYQEILENQSRKAERLRQAAGRGAQQQAANPTAPTDMDIDDKGPPSYVAQTGAALRPAAVPMAAQPGPMQAPSPLSQGSLSQDQVLAMALASGWTPSIPRMRLQQEAFSSMFAC